MEESQGIGYRTFIELSFQERLRSLLSWHTIITTTAFLRKFDISCNRSHIHTRNISRTFLFGIIHVFGNLAGYFSQFSVDNRLILEQPRSEELVVDDLRTVVCARPHAPEEETALRKGVGEVRICILGGLKQYLS